MPRFRTFALATAVLGVSLTAGSIPADACWWVFASRGNTRTPDPEPVVNNNPAPIPAPVDDGEAQRLRDRNRELEDALAKRDLDNRRIQETKNDDLARERFAMTLAERDAELAKMRRELDARAVPVPLPVPAPPIVRDEEFGKGTKTVETEEQVVITLQDTVLFDSGKADIKPAARGTLGKISDVIRDKYMSNRIEVVGHTDVQPIRRSSWKDNMELSVARADSVVRHLKSIGVDAPRLQASGRGEHEPVSTDWAKNRRVEIVIWLKEILRTAAR